MAHSESEPPFSLIVGLHDIAETPDAQGEELASWLPFSRVRGLLDSILANSRAIGMPLHITSDDAFRSDVDLLLPWLLANRVGATFFIPTDFVGRPGRLAVADLRRLQVAGMRLGVHGARHKRWQGSDAAGFKADVREGRDRLQQWLGAAVDLVAPPYGAYDGAVVRWLVAEGFREIHTSRSGIAVAGEVLRPRNMLKEGNIDAVLDTSRRRGGLYDRARARIRHLRAQLEPARAA